MNATFQGNQPMIGHLSLFWIQIVKISPKLAPIFGVASFMYVLLDYQYGGGDQGSPWVEAWRIALTLAVGIFVTLCGVIYRDVNRRITENARIQSENHKESQRTLAEINNRQERMVGVMLSLAVRDTDGDRSTMLEAVKMLMSK